MTPCSGRSQAVITFAGDTGWMYRPPRVGPGRRHLGWLAVGLALVIAVDAGATWGPDVDGPAILRIDHILTTPDLAPRDAAVDCDASASDHCLLEAVIGLPAA